MYTEYNYTYMSAIFISYSYTSMYTKYKYSYMSMIFKF